MLTAVKQCANSGQSGLREALRGPLGRHLRDYMQMKEQRIEADQTIFATLEEEEHACRLYNSGHAFRVFDPDFPQPYRHPLHITICEALDSSIERVEEQALLASQEVVYTYMVDLL